MEDHYNEAYLLRTIALAKENATNGSGGPFAALVVKDGEVIAEAANTVTPDNDPTAHAEVNAIRQACRQLGTFSLEGCQVYTSCEPCPMCFGAIFWARPDVLYFAATKQQAADNGFDDGLIYEQIALPHEQRKIPFVQKMVAGSEQPFEAWNNNKEKVNY